LSGDHKSAAPWSKHTSSMPSPRNDRTLAAPHEHLAPSISRGDHRSPLVRSISPRRAERNMLSTQLEDHSWQACRGEAAAERIASRGAHASPLHLVKQSPLGGSGDGLRPWIPNRGTSPWQGDSQVQLAPDIIVYSEGSNTVGAPMRVSLLDDDHVQLKARAGQGARSALATAGWGEEWLNEGLIAESPWKEREQQRIPVRRSAIQDHCSDLQDVMARLRRNRSQRD